MKCGLLFAGADWLSFIHTARSSGALEQKIQQLVGSSVADTALWPTQRGGSESNFPKGIAVVTYTSFPLIINQEVMCGLFWCAWTFLFESSHTTGDWRRTLFVFKRLRAEGFMSAVLTHSRAAAAADSIEGRETFDKHTFSGTNSI